MTDHPIEPIERGSSLGPVVPAFASRVLTRWLGGTRTFELRHKRRAPLLYAQVRTVLAPHGLFVVCDHEPPPTRVRAEDLHATATEQRAMLAAAGFTEIETLALVDTLYVLAARA